MVHRVDSNIFAAHFQPCNLLKFFPVPALSNWLNKFVNDTELTSDGLIFNALAMEKYLPYSWKV